MCACGKPRCQPCLFTLSPAHLCTQPAPSPHPSHSFEQNSVPRCTLPLRRPPRSVSKQLACATQDSGPTPPEMHIAVPALLACFGALVSAHAASSHEHIVARRAAAVGAAPRSWVKRSTHLNKRSSCPFATHPTLKLTMTRVQVNLTLTSRPPPSSAMPLVRESVHRRGCREAETGSEECRRRRSQLLRCSRSCSQHGRGSFCARGRPRHLQWLGRAQACRRHRRRMPQDDGARADAHRSHVRVHQQ